MKLQVRTLFAGIIACMIMIPGIIPAAFGSTNDDTPFMVKSFKLSSGSLYVSTSGGAIRVEGGNSNEVRVEVYVRSNKYSDEKIKKIVDEDYDISITKNGSRVEAIAKRVSNFRSWNGISISFVVYTPKNFNCELRTSGGSLKLIGVTGKSHELVTSGGSILAEQASGRLNAKTSGGSITIRDYDGDIDARTSGGGIKMEDVNGDIEVVTSGGGIKITDVQGSLYAATSGGPINAEITKLTDQLKLKTSGGSIKATIPDGIGLDLDLRGNRVVTTLSHFSGETKTGRITGTVNGGGIPVEMATSGGSVYLDFQ